MLRTSAKSQSDDSGDSISQGNNTYLTGKAGTSLMNSTSTSVRKSVGDLESSQVKSKTPSPATRSQQKQSSKNPLPDGAPIPTKRISIGPNSASKTSPKKTASKTKSRVELAREQNNKAKMLLSNSRNLRSDIKEGVIFAIERLYQIVKEAETELERKHLTMGVSKSTPTHDDVISLTPQVQLAREDGLTTKIEEQTKLLMENSRKIDELKGLIESKKETLKEDTYASVTSKSSNRERVALHSIIVSSEKEEETGEEILEKVRKAVDAKEGWVTVEKVRKAKDRKIVMGCKTQEERRKLKERLETAQQQLIVEEVKNKDPLVVLRDVLTIHSDDDILQALRKQNRSAFYGLDTEEDRMIVKYRKRARNPLNGHIILSVSPQIWNRLLEARKVRIDLQQIQVEDQSPLVQCTRCLGYGHSRKFCKESADLCSHCGGLHLSAECPERLSGAPPECKNCTRAKFDHCAHNAFSNECPVRRKWDRLARALVAYC